MLGGRWTGISDTGRHGNFTVRRRLFRRGVDPTHVDAQAFADIGRGVVLIPSMSYAVVRLVTGLSMSGELCRDEYGKGLVMRAGTRVSDGSNKKCRRGQDRVDSTPITESLAYRWIGRWSHRRLDRVLE
jgi:hypothetical protein